MKLWKQNRLDKEFELPNSEIAKQFLASTFPKRYYSIRDALVYFITSPDGLNSSWEWDEKRGSVDGSKDMIKILEIIKEIKTK